MIITHHFNNFTLKFVVSKYLTIFFYFLETKKKQKLMKKIKQLLGMGQSSLKKLEQQGKNQEACWPKKLVKKDQKYSYDPQDPEYHKVVLIGSVAGKTSLFNVWNQYPFPLQARVTTGMDYYFKKIKIGESNVGLEIWDTPGKEKFYHIIVNYFRLSKGFIFVYDITSRQTFNSLKNFWLPRTKQDGPQNTVHILIGNKSDLYHRRQVTMQEGIQLANQWGMQFIETSASNGSNVEQALIVLGEQIAQKIYEYKSQRKKIKSKNAEVKEKIIGEKAEKAQDQVRKRQVQEKDKKISELMKKLKIEQEKAVQSQEYKKRMLQLQESLNKIKEEEQKKNVQPEKREKDFYEILSQNEVGDITIQILKSQEIKSFKELKYFKDEDLKALGIKLGDIARIRQIN